MRHHGTIKEDRRGLAAVAGLLFGILAGVAFIGWWGDDPTARTDADRPAVAELSGR